MNYEIIEEKIKQLNESGLLEQYYSMSIGMIFIDKTGANRSIHISPSLRLDDQLKQINQRIINQETFNYIRDIFKKYNYVLVKKETDKHYVYYPKKE